MKQNVKKSAKFVSAGEWTGYIVGGVIALWGLALMITNLVGKFLPGLYRDNAVKNAESAVMTWSKIPLDFLGWGTIFFVIGMLVVFIILMVRAKKYDVEAEKAARRAARMGL